MEFRVLGPVEVRAAGRLLDAGHGRQRAVLTVLLLELGRVVPAARLIDRVWGEDAPASARNIVYGHIARLRAVLASAADDCVALTRRQAGYLLQVEPDRVDLHRFRRLTDQAAASRDDEAVETLLREALGLWHGPALAGLDSPWLSAMRHTLELERHAAQLDLNDIRLRRGQHISMTAELVSQAVTAPTDERLIGQLMLALYRSGQQAEALRWFGQTRRHLGQELGAEPGPQLQELHEQILRADPTLRPPHPAVRSSQQVTHSPRQLPGDVASFTGRAAELEVLDQLLAPRHGAATATAVISAIGGTPGIGKTALAVHWAHRVADRFGDGQLYVNLRGFDPSGTPVTPEAAIRGFLPALGVPPERMPATAVAQAGLYRGLLADKRMLIVLDNARDEQQVRPLLPASHGTLVIVTSRSQLGGLAAADGARLLTLDVLPRAEAVQLLSARLGTDRVGAEPDAVAEIAALCACLPLALAVTAARAAARPAFPLAALAAELRAAAGRLDALDAGDPSASVRAVFSWSCRQLSQEAARLFRLLGLHPGPDISIPAAASLAGCGEPEARTLLRELSRGCLITEHVPGRYAFHDLLRAYATEQAHARDNQEERDAAVGRVLDHYLHTAASAAFLLSPAKEPIDIITRRPGVIAPQLADYAQALAWFEAQLQVLLAAVALAVRTGHDNHAWQLPWAMASFLQIRGHWPESAAIQRIALDAAARLGHAAGQAMAGRFLAVACVELGDHDRARGHFADSLALYRGLGNRLGEARIQQDLGVMAASQGRHAAALGHNEEALRLFEAIGEKLGQAHALNNIGWYHGTLGHYQLARSFCHRALTLNAEAGDRRAEGQIWDTLGYAEHHLGNFARAAACYERALRLQREVGDRRYEAEVLTHLGDTRHSADELAQARDAWEQALAILDDLHHADADAVRARLAALEQEES
jgi:DNA-binding SARP family transcriptional activator/tetratricopeptide (TPR) repeat protein